jgi:hypothetical protein
MLVATLTNNVTVRETNKHILTKYSIGKHGRGDINFVSYILYFFILYKDRVVIDCYSYSYYYKLNSLPLIEFIEKYVNIN